MEKFCTHCGKEVENLENLNFCPFCGKNLKNEEIKKNEKKFINNQQNSVLELIFTEPRTTLFMILTVLYSPFVLILNDIIGNKNIYNNEFWIKRVRLYFLICVVMYVIFILIFQLDMKNMELMKLAIIYSLVTISAKIHFNMDSNVDVYVENSKLTEEEVNIVNIVQKRDIQNFDKKIGFRKIFFSVWALLLAMSFIFLFKNMDTCFVVLILLLIAYDVFEQKYFERDIMKLFWKKRILYYILFSLPALFVLYLSLIDFRI